MVRGPPRRAPEVSPVVVPEAHSLALLDFLDAPAGARLLDAARATRDLAAHRRPGALAGLGTPEQIRAALTQDSLRLRAAAKTPHAERLLYTREALEQASPWPVARDRALRFGLAPGALLADLTAGIGFDALAAAEAGLRVIALERDPLRARLLAFNARALGLDGQVEVREADALAAPPPADAAFLDPDRRAHGRRTRDAADFEPPLAAWPALLAGYARAIVKTAPAARDDATAVLASEVVSLGGEARERRLLWRGFQDAAPRRALALPGGASVSGAGRPWPAPRLPAAGLWLFDPDVSVTLADLVGEVAHEHGLAPVHEAIAYLLGEEAAPSAPGTWLRIEAVLAPEAGPLDAWLTRHDVGQVEIRCRGVADDASAWRKRIRPRGRGAATLVFTRGCDDRWVALAARRAPLPLDPVLDAPAR